MYPKRHTFDVRGGRSVAIGEPNWPDVLTIKMPKHSALALITKLERMAKDADSVEVSLSGKMTFWIDVDEQLPPSGKKVIIAYKNSYGKPRRIVGHYLEQYKEECRCEYDCDCEYHETHDCYYYPAGWYEQIDNWDDYSCVRVVEGTPEYWCELPKSPYGE